MWTFLCELQLGNFIVCHQDPVAADRGVSDLAYGSDEALVALLNLGVALEAVLDDLEDAETFNLSSLKTPAGETVKRRFDTF